MMSGSTNKDPFVILLLGGLLLMTASVAQADGGAILIEGSEVGYTITFPGSYRLTGDRIRSGAGAAILVDADNVVLDLGGHAVAGGPLSASIFQQAGRQRLTVRNGRLAGNTNAAYGILASGTGNRFENLVFEGTTIAALDTGPGARLRNLRIHDMTLNDPSSIAVRTGPGSLVSEVTFAAVTLNGGGSSLLSLGTGSVARTVSAAGNSGPTGSVIRAGAGSVLQHISGNNGSGLTALSSSGGPVVLAGFGVNGSVAPTHPAVIADGAADSVRPGRYALVRGVDAAIDLGAGYSLAGRFSAPTLTAGPGVMVRDGRVISATVASGAYVSDLRLPSDLPVLTLTGAYSRVDRVMRRGAPFSIDNDDSLGSNLIVRGSQPFTSALLSNTGAIDSAATWFPQQTNLVTDRPWANLDR